MYLTKIEEEMLRGEHGYAAQKAMEILTALGKVYGASRMIEIKSAQVSGISYKNLGEEGLEFLEELARDGRVRVLTTLNPAGMDLEHWREMGVPEEFAENQLRVIRVFARMGATLTLTCTPYLAGNTPEFGEHVAWSESSAVVYANSVLGARTNREGGPSALAAALVGRTPLYGLHLDENRLPTIEIRTPETRGEYMFAALGYLAGKIARDGVPLFKGIRGASLEELKALGAALASSGGVALFHIENLTPEARRSRLHAPEKQVIEERELEEALSELDEEVDPDLIFLGCPHLSLREVERVTELLGGRKVRRDFWLCMSREIISKAEELGLVEKLRKSGVTIAADTCPIVAPIREMGYRSIATNSAKAALYSRNLNRLKVRFLPLDKLIELATRG